MVDGRMNGLAVVPIEPTEKMRLAGMDALTARGIASNITDVWKAMLAESTTEGDGVTESQLRVMLGDAMRRIRELEAARPEVGALGWRPMWELPQVTEQTEMLFRKEWTGRDDKVRATHEVLILWPDGVLSDFTETTVAPEEMPTHWMPLPAFPSPQKATE